MTQNFTQPYMPPEPPQGGTPRDPRPRSDDGTKVWDETGGPNGQGAWVTPNEAPSQRRTFDSQQWGGRGSDVDANGNPIAGTSGAEREISRFEDMQGPVHATGPAIDQSRGNESRAIGSEAIDLMRRNAEGTSPSVAENLGTQLGQNAQNARFGIAASVRGGAAARAAAARGAQADAGTIGQRTLASNAATRAGEMANSRGAYFGASSGMRGQDLDVATSQGKLEVGQRGANDQRDAFYANKAQDVRKAELDAQLKRSASEAAAADAKRQADAVAQGKRDENMRTFVDTSVSAVGGAKGGYTGSDKRIKKDVSPVSKSAASRIRSKAKTIANEDPLSDDPNGSPGDPLNGYIARQGTQGPSYGGPRKGPLTNADAGNLGGFKREVGDGSEERNLQREYLTSNPEQTDTEERGLQREFLGQGDADRNAAAEGRVASSNRREHGLDDTSRPERKPRLISDLEAAKLKKQGEAMMAQTEDLKRAHGLGTVNTPGNESAARGEVEESPRARVKARMGDIVRDDPYNDRPKATWGKGERAGGSDELHEAMRQSVEKDKGPPERKMNPENPYTSSLFGHAEPGYASGRAGERGGMFGEHLAGQGSIREENRVALGTRDFFGSLAKNRTPEGLPKDLFSQEIMMSDQRAKQEAFAAGANWSLNGGEGGVPKYMPGTVDSQGGAKRADSPIRGKDSTSQAALEEYPTDPSKRSPEDRANVVQLHQFVNDNEGDEYTRANPPGAGPPAESLNPREGTPDQGVPRTSVANDMRKRTREYVTQQDRDETPEQRTSRFLKKAQSRDKGAEKTSSSPSSANNDGESPDDRTQRFLKKSQDKSRPGAPAKWDTSSKVGPRSKGEEKPSILPSWMQPGQKIPGRAGEIMDKAGKRLTGPSAADEARADQDAQIHSNQLLTDKLQNLQTQGEIDTLRKRAAEQGITSSDERTKNVRFGGPMADANRSMEPKVYEYKDGFAQKEGQNLGDVNVGPIAQKMKKDPVASTVIVDDPESGMLGIDKAKGLKLVMGGLADLQRQVDGLAGKKKEKK